MSQLLQNFLRDHSMHEVNSASVPALRQVGVSLGTSPALLQSERERYTQLGLNCEHVFAHKQKEIVAFTWEFSHG